MESCKSYAIHRSNQISDDHIESIHRGQSFVNLERQRGGTPVFLYSLEANLSILLLSKKVGLLTDYSEH